MQCTPALLLDSDLRRGVASAHLIPSWLCLLGVLAIVGDPLLAESMQAISKARPPNFVGTSPVNKSELDDNSDENTCQSAKGNTRKEEKDERNRDECTHRV
mmetsp:Transcript_258/g.377  ORF Transcript_258/g.377 Transcript_258/m.377 type:complete len:101 (+) Transcript_258:169-471(+)